MSGRILIIEDDEFKANDIQSLLKRELPTYAVLVVGDVGSGVKALRGSVFDLVILDIALPSRQLRPGGGSTASLLSGGVEIIYRLEEENRSVPVVILTQYPDIEIEGEQVPVSKMRSVPERYFDANIVACIRYMREDQASWTTTLSNVLKDLG
ncbi:MAG: response regulator [Antarcticimicrobium sp.]|nr:response regulator [Antarcticimicrobium sp.]